MLFLSFVCLMHIFSIEASDQDYEVTLSYPMGDRSMDVIDTSRVQVESYNDSFSYAKGEIDIKKDLDEYTYMELIAQREESGEWKTVVAVDFNVCEEVDKGGDSDLHHLFTYYDIKKCPIKSGTYAIHKEIHKRKENDGEDKPHRLMVHMNVYNKHPDEEQEYIHMVTVDIVPKEK